MRVARELAEPLVQGEQRPIVFAEKRPRAGKGGAAFKSLTAAVRAAEREKEEARAFKLAAEKVLVEAEARLRASERVWQAERCAAWRVLLLTCVLFVGCVVMTFFMPL